MAGSCGRGVGTGGAGTAWTRCGCGTRVEAEHVEREREGEMGRGWAGKIGLRPKKERDGIQPRELRENSNHDLNLNSGKIDLILQRDLN